MNFQSLDLFSTQFQFNIGLKERRKRSKIGAFLSIAVVTTFLIYFVYLLFLYIGNQIDPKYKMQTFISQEGIQVDLHNNFLAFRFELMSHVPLEEKEKQTGKIYLVYKAFFYATIQKQFEMIELNIIECQDQQLDGYHCLDFSKISKYTLHLDEKQQILNNLFVFVYRCQDTDMYKQTIPDNCANPEEIDTLINNTDTLFKMKMYTSQYNTVQQQMQPSYKNLYINMQGEDLLIARVKTVKQTTTVKKGPFIQQQTSFSSPIDYIKEERAFYRKSLNQKNDLRFNLFIQVDLDEQVQIIQIQYASFMEILAICNSTLALLMGIGAVGRYFANQLIREDIQLLLLQNLYQSQYLNALKKYKIFQPQILVKEENQEKSIAIAIENTQQICIPTFFASSGETFNLTQSNFNQKLRRSAADKKLYTSQQTNQNQSPQSKNQIKKNQIQIEIESSNLSPKVVQKQVFIQKPENKSTNEDISSPILTNALLENLKAKQFEIKNTNQEITQPNQTNKLLENLKAIQDLQYRNKFSESLFNLKNLINLLTLQLSFFKKCSSKLHKQLGPHLNKLTDEQVNKTLDVLHLYKDIIILKKAMMMLLSKEQFAAIQLTGFSNQLQSSLKIKQGHKIRSKDLEQQKQKKQLNHLDEQHMISQSLESQIEYFDKFLQRMQSSEEKTSVDQRIYESITSQ